MNLCFLKSPLGQVAASRKETNIPSGTQPWEYCNRIMTESSICKRPWQPGHASGFMRISGKEVWAALLCFSLYKSTRRCPGQSGSRADPWPFYPAVVCSCTIPCCDKGGDCPGSQFCSTDPGGISGDPAEPCSPSTAQIPCTTNFLSKVPHFPKQLKLFLLSVTKEP